MEKILIRAFHDTLPGLDLPKWSVVDFSKEKRNEIIDQIMDAGYNVCLQNSIYIETPMGEKVNALIIWYDKYRFQQR